MPPTKRSAAKDTASSDPPESKKSTRASRKKSTPVDADNDTRPNSDAVGKPVRVTTTNKTTKRKKSAAISKATTKKSQSATTKPLPNDAELIPPAGIIPSYQPSEYASPLISTNVEGARKSGRIIFQTEKGRQYYAPSDDDDDEDVMKTAKSTKGAVPPSNLKRDESNDGDDDDDDTALPNQSRMGDTRTLQSIPKLPTINEKVSAVVMLGGEGDKFLGSLLDGGKEVVEMDAMKGGKDMAREHSTSPATYSSSQFASDVEARKGGKVVAQEDAQEDAKLPATSSFSAIGTQDAVVSMPLIDDGLFASDDFMAAIGQEVPTRKKTSEYATIGLSKTRISKSGVMAPVKPNYDGMSPGTKSVAMKAHSKKLKGFRDLLLRERRKECEGRAINWDKIQYDGDNFPNLRTMDMVKLRRLQAGDNFIDKHVVQLRIAEEANLRGIKIRWLISNNSRMVVKGENFEVIANLNDKRGWVVKIAAVRSGDDGVGDLDDVVDTDSEYEDNGDDDDSIGEDDDDGDDGNGEDDFIMDDDGVCGEVKVKAKAPKLRSPLSSSWIVPLIKTVITVKPNTSNKDLRHLLQFHCRTYALTRALLQKARDMAKLQVFGR